MKETIAWIAMIATGVQVLYGMSMQLRKLSVEKSTKGLSLAAVASAGFGFFAWTTWSLIPPGINAYIAIPNGLGVLFTLAILWRMWRLRNRSGE